MLRDVMFSHRDHLAVALPFLDRIKRRRPILTRVCTVVVVSIIVMLFK